MILNISHKMHSIYSNAHRSINANDFPTRNMFVRMTKLHSFRDPSNTVSTSITLTVKHLLSTIEEEDAKNEYPHS